MKAGRGAKHGLGIAIAVAAPLAGLAAVALLGLHHEDTPYKAAGKAPVARVLMEAPEAPPEGDTAANAGPVMARDAAVESAGAIGALRSMTGSWNGPTSSYGSDQSLGSDPMSAIGALMGDQIGSNYGYGGLGLRGTGRGGGGVGMGSLGTIGHGAGPAGLPPGSRIDLPSSHEGYAHVPENDFVPTTTEATSTFAIDVDTASYSNVRRFLRDGSLPPADAVRVEEMLNYFDHGYRAPPPGAAHPFAIHAEVGACPWEPSHRLVQVGIQAARLDQRDVPRRNLVFLVDVSGSMSGADRLPLLVSGMQLLADNLRASDRVAIVVYAGAAGLVLPSTAGDDRETIRRALASLEAGGSTNGGDGIRLAYRVAREHFIRGGINRVILATDGDFNVGITGRDALRGLIEGERRSGVFLTVLGFGAGNLQDDQMEQLADRGNGNYAYIDSIAEARRVLVREAGGTLWTIAQDVKIQLEFDPARVRSHRLIGYENRMLRREDFEDDTVDAGEVGAGHAVTALYEIDPVAGAGDLGRVSVRYQPPGGGRSVPMSARIVDRGEVGSARLGFASATAGFGMLLRGSSHRGSATPRMVEQLAESAVGADPHGHRAELVSLIRAARHLGLR